MDSRQLASLPGRFRRVVGDDGVLGPEEDLSGYSHDEFAEEGVAELPGTVCRPRTTDELASIVSICAEEGVPVTLRGGGTGLSGGCIPVPGGVVLSTERMRSKPTVDAANRTVTVDAGLPLGDLYEAVEQAGFFFPPHPGDEQATVGGAVATNAGGSRAVKYGTVRDFVLGIKAVLADGTVADFGGTVRKATCGYDLKDLIIGSEGTLAIITEVTVALMSPPGYTLTLVAPFDTVRDAIDSVPAVLHSGITPMAVEFVEHETIRCAERLLERTWPAREGDASCMFVLDADDEDQAFGVAERLADVLEQHAAGEALVATDSKQQRDILELRSTIYEALRPATAELLDVCVPLSQIADHVGFVASLAEAHDVQLPTYGHAADGNVHTHLLSRRLHDGSIGEEIQGDDGLRLRLRDEIFADAVSRGGVISGEHGIGTVKRDYLAGYTPPALLELMRGIKRVFDPTGILNPGKLLSDSENAR